MLDARQDECGKLLTKPIVDASDIDERDVEIAVASLDRAPFKSRYPRMSANAPDLQWQAPNGSTIHEHVRDRMSAFKRSVATYTAGHLRGSVFHTYDAATLVTVANHLGDLQPPTARDLLHVYGPDRNNTHDADRYYRYAWSDKGPNGIIYSSATQAINEGVLSCNSYAYSGQSSFALAGTGMFFIPRYGDAKISIRPFVNWSTTASFTGTEAAPASATAFLGIFVESWSRAGGAHNVDTDFFIPVWSQNTQGYMTHVGAGGSATVSDGLATEVLAVASRKYAIYVYAYLETSAAPQQGKNELRFCTLDIDASVPYVVVQEKLL